jgi:glucose/arabinose dehydrogenase
VGEQKPEASLPFTMTTVTTFKLPWRLAFLPDGRMLITEKPGPVWLVSQQGEKIQVENTPPVFFSGPERHARRIPLATLRHRPQHLSHLC